ncbi:zinc transporter ZIP11-like [Rhopilema esculentum]|uniref:zinc transporter ZIP11-like n=1 Tax=Rhopilema esculentum TaxID=499914 RepID=UPI0031D22866|eukprot:gene9538-17284_t
MIADANPVFQAFLGTLFTWGLTAAGAALVFVFNSGQRKVLDGSLGFAAGVMTAASYWSLLAPAIEMASSSNTYGTDGKYSFVPVSIGFFLGALFVYGSDQFLTFMGISSPNIALALEKSDKEFKNDGQSSLYGMDGQLNDQLVSESIIIEQAKDFSPFEDGESTVHARKRNPKEGSMNEQITDDTYADEITPDEKRRSWRRILLLIVAITVHNIPEGLAVGVGFGSIGKSKLSTLESARNLAIGIGIQNFPEGLAVSLPLRGSGYSALRSFWYGQLSGMVEPIAGIFGAFAVVIAEPLLPYALSFAAGAMIYVVVDDIIPEAQMSGNGTLASWGSVVGFIVMMSLDVGLG